MDQTLVMSPVERRDRFSALLAICIFAILSLLASVWSQGFSEADGCTHYLYARFAFAQPYYLVNVWGRPLVTALYAVPAVMGDRFGVRTASLVLAIGCALVARAIAKDIGDRRRGLAAIFTLAQPLLFLHSFSELTELPFALLLGCTFLAYVRRQWLVMAVLASLTPLARPEGFGFVLLAAVALLVHRRWWWVAVLPLPLIGWDIAGWVLYGEPVYAGFAQRLPHALTWITWLGNNWPYADKSAYQPGSIFHYVMLLPAVASPMVFPAMMLGIWRTRRSSIGDHLGRCRVLTAVIPILILIVHSVLYYTGRMASSGELRYMLVVAPFWGVLSARGWVWLTDRFGFSKDAMLIAGFISLAPIAANHYYRVIPLTYSPDWAESREVAAWLDRTRFKAEYPRLLISHPGVFYFGISLVSQDRSMEWSRSTIENPPKGTILVWDDVYGLYNSDTTRTVRLDQIHAAHWIDESAVLGDGEAASHWHVFLSPRTLLNQPSAVRARPAVPHSHLTPGSDSASSAE